MSTERSACKCLRELAEKRPIGRRDGVLSHVTDIEDRASRLQYAEMVAFHGEQRVVDNRIIGVMLDWSHDLLTIIRKRRNNLADTLHDHLPALNRLV
jgi:hypothetical protein